MYMTIDRLTGDVEVKNSDGAPWDQATLNNKLLFH
jgi:hypothetical protein